MSTTTDKKHAAAAVKRSMAALASMDHDWLAPPLDFRRSKQIRNAGLRGMHAPQVAEAGGAAPPRIDAYATPPRPDTALALFETDRLDRRCIDRLIAREILAVKVGEFVPRSQALDIGAQLMDCAPHLGFDGELRPPPGMPFHEVLTRPDLLDAYFAQAPLGIAAVRKCCAPYSSPVDTLRCILDEIWPAGAHLHSIEGRKMAVGLPNMLPSDVCIQARHHAHDHAALALPVYGPLRHLLVCDICLCASHDEGELLIWEPSRLAPEARTLLREAEHDIDPILLGAPSLRIPIEPGALVVFDARQPYAVNDGSGAARMSLSLFVGYRGEHMPLTYWS